MLCVTTLGAQSQHAQLSEQSPACNVQQAELNTRSSSCKSQRAKRSSHNANSRRKAKPKHLQRLHHDDNPSSPDRLSDGRRSPGRRDPRISSKGWIEYVDRMPDNEADRKLASGKLLEPGSAAEARALSCRYRREQVKERLKLLEPSEGFGNGNDDADSTVDEFVRSDDGLPGSATSPGPPGAGL